MKLLDRDGLSRFLNKIKTIIPTKTSDITNDSGFLTSHNPVDSALSETSENAVQNKVVKGALDGKSDTGHTHLASEVSGLSTVATSGSYNDLSNTPTIPTVNNKTLTIQKNGTTVKTFTANSASDVTANITVPTAVSELTNDSGYLTSASSLDSSKLTGTIDIARLPKGALERLVTVANQTARFALTTSDVQLGDTVKQLDTGAMYIVTDETKLSSADGYTEYTAGSATSVPWSGVTGKPSSYTPSSHTHGLITNDGKLTNGNRVVITGNDKAITEAAVSDTELSYLSGVTSAIQTQLDSKVSDANVVHKTGDETIEGTKTFNAGTAYISINPTARALTAALPVAIGATSYDEFALSIYSNKTDVSTGRLAMVAGGQNAHSKTGGSYLHFYLNTLANRAYRENGIYFFKRFANANKDAEFYPDYDDTIDLGKSGYRWKGVYSNAYYLGDTAFGDIVTHNASEFSASNHVHGNISNDGKVGTTANKPLITGTGGVVQAGSFGNAANTFCEGNDSRLSDARTPVAHTHLTADVTDLLSGNHTWTGDNTFSKTIISQSNEVLSTTSTSIGIGETPANEQQKVFNFKDKNNVSLSYFRHLYKTTGASQLDFIVRNKFTSGSPSTSGTIDYTSFSLELGSDGSKTGTLQATLKPSATSTYDLGTSSYKWRKVYSDDVVHTSGDESVSGTKSFNSDLNLNYASTDVDDIVNSVAGSATLDNFVHMTGNETVSGIKSFPDGIVTNVTGSATSATNDGSGNVISTTYGKLGAANTWTNTNICRGMLLLSNNTSDVAEQFQQKLPKDVTTSSDALVRFNTLVDSEGHYIVTNSEGHWDTYVAKTTTLKYKNDSTKQGTIEFRLISDGTGLLYPQSPFECSLGNYGNQWKSVYAQSYYYNGIAWGLDQVNAWSNFNRINGYRLEIKNYSQEIGVIPTSNQWNGFTFIDKNNNNTVSFEHAFMGSGETRFKISMVDNFASNSAGSPVTREFLRITTYSDGSAFCIGADARPLTNNTWNLGNSSNKWKTINGVNPGALSLPDTLGVSGTENVNYFNVIGYLNNTGTLTTIPSTATYDGWLYINAKDGAGSYIIVDDYPSSFGTSVFGNNGLGSNSVGLLCLICPIRVGHSYNVRIKSDGIVSARIYPAQGNV